MPVTRSSVLCTKLDAKLDAKDMDAARTLMRFHYDIKTMAAKPIAAKPIAAKPNAAKPNAAKPNRCEHNMSLRGRKASTRPRRQCAVYTPGMYAEDVV